MPRPDALPTRPWLLRLPHFVLAVARRFYNDGCLQHASALAYTTLLSIVPLLALMFSILKGLGVQRRLEPLLLSRLSLSPETTETIISYIDNTNVSTLGTLGAALLVVTVISVLGAVESSLNHIWRVRRGRTYWRMVTDYLSTILLTPMLLLAAVALATSVQEQSLMHLLLQRELISETLLQALRFAPVVINAVALAVLYAIMPNRRPNALAIVVGALTAGVAWYFVQWGYVTLQVGVARADAIYGAMAQLPVTLLWLYISWLVVLGGAEVAAVYELGPDATELNIYRGVRWPVAAHILLRAAEAFRDGEPPVEVRRISEELNLHSEIVRDVADRLHKMGALLPLEDCDAYLLARDPAAVDLAKVEETVDPCIVLAGCDARVRGAVDIWARERVGRQPVGSLADLLRLEPTPQETTADKPATAETSAGLPVTP